MTGTETFTVLSSENLEQTSGGRMIWLMIDIGIRHMHIV